MTKSGRSEAAVVKRLLFAGLLVIGAASPLRAHPLAPHLLELREIDGKRVQVRFKTSLLQPTGTESRPLLPDRCRTVATSAPASDAGSITFQWTADCGPQGIVGAAVGVSGLQASKTDALVRVFFRDGRVAQALLYGEHSSWTVPDGASPGRVARDYLRRGLLAFPTGIEHLAFLAALVLLAADGGGLLLAIVSFTIGHSLSLSLAGLGLLRADTALPGIAIAAALLLVAAELARGDQSEATLMRRHPWLLAAAAGPPFGLALAAALPRAALPSAQLPLAVFSFNAGLELGLLAVVLVLLAAARLWRAWRGRLPAWAAQGPAYVIGSLAAFWFIERAAALM